MVLIPQQLNCTIRTIPAVSIEIIRIKIEASADIPETTVRNSTEIPTQTPKITTSEGCTGALTPKMDPSAHPPQTRTNMKRTENLSNQKKTRKIRKSQKPKIKPKIGPNRQLKSHKPQPKSHKQHPKPQKSQPKSRKLQQKRQNFPVKGQHKHQKAWTIQ